MLALENRLVYFPIKYPEGNWRQPALDYEDVEIASTDGVTLHGWFAPVDRPRAVMLIMHGNSGNVTDMAYDLRVLRRQLHVAALAFDYRGYGKSTGSPSEAGVHADARAARKWLAERTGVAERDIVLWGFSMGSAVATDLAANDGARGLVLQNAFTSMPEVAARHYPWLPVRLLMRNRFDSAAKIGRYHGPVLQVHGTADSIVPFELGEQLHALVNEPKRFVAIKDADHNDPPDDHFYQALDAFLDTLPPMKAKE